MNVKWISRSLHSLEMMDEVISTEGRNLVNDGWISRSLHSFEMTESAVSGR